MANEFDDVRIVSGYILVSEELLMDCGAIPDTREYKPVHLPWRWHLHMKIGNWRERIAYRAFRVIAGYEVPEVE